MQQARKLFFLGLYFYDKWTNGNELLEIKSCKSTDSEICPIHLLLSKQLKHAKEQ